MTTRVRIVTDSDSDLPRSLLERYDITSLPATIWFGDRRVRADADLDLDAFYARLARGEHVGNAAPDPDLMRQTYLELASRGDPVVSIHVSRRYKETVDLVRELAAQMRNHAEIEVFDSQGVSLAEGLLVLRAAILAKTGAGLEQIRDVMRNLIPKTHALIAIDNLDFLRRTGKINGFQHLVGSMAGFKPIGALNADGVMELAGRCLSFEKALDELLRLVDERLSCSDEQVLGVFHTRRREEAKTLRDWLLVRYQPREIVVAEAGPSTIAQTGPGALGVAFFSETERK